MVPFLVLLPLVENADLAVGQPGQSTMTLVASLGPTALQTLLGLGALLLGGRVVLRRIFEMVGPLPPDGRDARDVEPCQLLHCHLVSSLWRHIACVVLWKQCWRVQLCTMCCDLTAIIYRRRKI